MTLCKHRLGKSTYDPGLKDLETLEDAYKVMEELNHFTQVISPQNFSLGNDIHIKMTGKISYFKYD